jgi:hypothetical protein
VEIECVDEVDYIGASDEAAEATATITMRRRLRSAHPWAVGPMVWGESIEGLGFREVFFFVLFFKLRIQRSWATSRAGGRKRSGGLRKSIRPRCQRATPARGKPESFAILAKVSIGFYIIHILNLASKKIRVN